MDEAANDTVAFEPAQLLSQHLLATPRDRAFEVGEAMPLAVEQLEQDDELPAPRDDLEEPKLDLRSRRLRRCKDTTRRSTALFRFQYLTLSSVLAMASAYSLIHRG